MPNQRDILIDQQIRNRDNLIGLARKAWDRHNLPLARNLISRAREWNRELVRIKRELH